MTDAEALGARIRALREKAKLSQQALAKAAGVSQNGLSKWERGEREPGFATMLRIAKALGVRVAAFETSAKPAKPAKRGRPKKKK
jgi:transcriptional regulator with XRE-family HTH domain